MKKILFFALLMSISMAVNAKVSKLEVSFDYERQAGPGSNQYAVWIENSKGEVVKTLFVTSYTTKGRARGNEQLVRGYKKRPLCVPTWVKNVKAEELSDTQLDAFTGATPKASGRQTFSWDFKDEQGKKVANGKYKIFVEATLINKSIVIYEGEFSIQGKAGNIQMKSTLTEFDEAHKNMITNVCAELK